MRRGCFSEIALARMSAGLGTPRQDEHLTRCERCAARYRRLGRDLELITGVLMDTAIAPTLRVRLRHTLPWRRLAFTSAVATLLVLIVAVGGLRWPSSAPAPRPAPTGQASPASPAPLALPTSVGDAGVRISMDPDALVGEAPSGADDGCASGATDIAAVGCEDDGGADTGLDVG